MKMKTKLLALALCLCFALMSVPVGGFAAGNEAKVIRPDGTSQEYATLEAANNAAAAGDTIELLTDVTLEAKLNLRANITLDGKNKKITTTSDLSTVQLLGLSNNSTLMNVTLDCNKKAKGGAQAYKTTGVLLYNVTITNSKSMFSLKVNGAEVKAMGLTITGTPSGKPSIDVEPGSGVDTPSILTFYGSKINLDVNKPIRCDNWNSHKDKVTVTARNYNVTEGNSWNYHYWTLGDPKREYIDYIANGGTGTMEDTPVPPDNHGNSCETTLAQNGFTPPDGMMFAGWTTSHDANATVYNENDADDFKVYGNTGNITQSSSTWNDDLVLFAKWKSAKVNVTFDGGEINGVPISGHETQPAGEWTDLDPGEITLPENPYTADGYAFTGWKCSANGTVYQPNNTYNVTEDVTFTAQWAMTSATITFDPNGGSGTGPDAITAAVGSTITLPENSFTPPEGKCFVGWKSSVAGDNKLYHGGDSFSVPAQNVTFTAQWDRAYTVTFDMNFDPNTASQPVPPNMSDEQVANGGTLTINNPVRNGYTFNGWGTSPGGPVVYHVTEGADTISYTHKIDKNITLYAVWKIIFYDITYDLNANGSDVTNINPSRYTVEDTITLNNPVWQGHTFKGWTKNGDSNQTPQTEITITAGTTGDITFTAHWETQSFTVTFKIVYGTWHNGETAEITITVTNGTLNPEDIPTGLIPNAGYQPNPVGWDKTINTAEGGVTENITYTYTFVPLT